MTDKLKSYEEFLKAVCQNEASGNYKAENRFGYKGCYQMGVPAMIDIGYYKPNPGVDIYANKWNEGQFTTKSGINNINDFLNSPKVQDKAITEYKKIQWNMMKDVQNYVGKTVGGIPITESAMIGAAQLGHDKVIKYLKSNGQIIEGDYFETPVTKLLNLYKGYDVSQITHPQGISQEPKIQKNVQQRVQQQLLQNSHKNILYNMVNPTSRFKPNSIMYKNRGNSFSTGYAAPLDIFTPEQIGSMSPSEFTQNESAIMNQLEQGLIGNLEVASAKK